MGLFANGDEQYNQGQRPWVDAQRAVFANGDNQPVNTTVIIIRACRAIHVMRTLSFAAEYYQWNPLRVLSASALPFLLFTTSSNSHIPLNVQVSGMTCACLPCHNRTKIQIGQS